MTNKTRPTGYVIYEDANIVSIATVKTNNPKTGDMVQIWFLVKDVDPVTAIKTGQDDFVCFDCSLRGDGTGKERPCYVRVNQAPLAIWKAWKNGRYPFLKSDGYQSVFGGRKIRFGAYGEPVLLPLAIVAELARVSDGWTGYTHQWKHAEYDGYRAFFMASCDDSHDYIEAKARGWRTFRVRTSDDTLRPNEIACPASDEMNHRTTCSDCKLCSGVLPTVYRETPDGMNAVDDTRKDIAIIVHGSQAKNFVSIASIGGVK